MYFFNDNKLINITDYASVYFLLLFYTKLTTANRVPFYMREALDVPPYASGVLVSIVVQK